MVDGELLLDLEYAEDSIAEVDMNVVMDGRGRFIEVQGTAERRRSIARDSTACSTSRRGIDRLVVMQRKVLAEDLDVFESLRAASTSSSRRANRASSPRSARRLTSTAGVRRPPPISTREWPTS